MCVLPSLVMFFHWFDWLFQNDQLDLIRSQGSSVGDKYDIWCEASMVKSSG